VPTKHPCSVSASTRVLTAAIVALSILTGCGGPGVRPDAPVSMSGYVDALNDSLDKMIAADDELFTLFEAYAGKPYGSPDTANQDWLSRAKQAIVAYEVACKSIDGLPKPEAKLAETDKQMHAMATACRKYSSDFQKAVESEPEPGKKWNADSATKAQLLKAAGREQLLMSATSHFEESRKALLAAMEALCAAEPEEGKRYKQELDKMKADMDDKKK